MAQLFWDSWRDCRFPFSPLFLRDCPEWPVPPEFDQRVAARNPYGSAIFVSPRDSYSAGISSPEDAAPAVPRIRTDPRGDQF